MKVRQSLLFLGNFLLTVPSFFILIIAILLSLLLFHLILKSLIKLKEVTAQARQVKRAESAPYESEERYALAARAANDGLWDWNLKTNEIYFSTRWKSMLGYVENDISNSLSEWFNRVHPQDIKQLKAAIVAHFKGLTDHFENEHRMLHKNGQYRWMLSRGLAVRSADGKLYRIAGSQTGITQSKVAEALLLHHAFHDALTQLPNLVLFLKRLRHALLRTKQSEDYLFAVLFLDLDRFKVVNYSLGHMLADQLLIAISRRLEACLRPGDTVARFGGDEFTILLENIQDVEDATKVAECIQQELKLPFNLSGHEVFATASIGIALSTHGYDRPEDLLRDAEVTMYRAKALGKARSEVFDRTMHTQAMTLLELETSLRRALERKEFCLHYQPIVSLKSGRISGFEALLRWQQPRGLVSPAEFIPVAEETGLIVPIGWWVLREACSQMRVWQVQFPAKAYLKISVNLSSKQFLQPTVVEQINQILQETDLDARCLEVEITESAIMENAEEASVMLKQLRALGVQLFLDDFGTGYSSLSYLQHFPFNTLKIDRSFISRIGGDSENSQIVRTIVTLAHNLDMNVTAEGVETAAQLAQLCAIQCEHGQGYFFSQPVDCETAGALIAAEPHWYGDLKRLCMQKLFEDIKILPPFHS
jgi:diguanylate cyclase (GGDEF)-like protein/PAS domain S-box-containing protein